MNNDKDTTVAELKKMFENFVQERNWTQFHNAKDLSLAISIEAAELLEHFLWINKENLDERVKDRNTQIQEELADIVIFAIAFCNRYNIDLTSAIVDKMEKNAKKYPVEKAFGKANKYNEL